MPLGPRTHLKPKLTALAATLLLFSQLAAAQTEAPKADKGLERAQKAADNVFRWIKLNGDKGATRAPVNPAAAAATAPGVAAAPAPAAPQVARKPAPAPTPVAAAPRPATAPAPTAVDPAPAPVLAQSTAPAPAAPRTATTALASRENPPMQLAMATPTPEPMAPMTAAASAVEPPPQEEEEDEVELRLVKRVNPTIPRQLQQVSFRNGFARVKFTIATNGSVSQAESIGASHVRLGMAAIDAVKQWRFEPIAEPREVAIEFAFNNSVED
jgi:TonB family protein